MKATILFLSVFFSLIIFTITRSEPGFNGTTPGCGSGGGCHTQQSGLVSAASLTNLQVQITVSGATGNVGGELVDGNGNVVAVINTTSSNPFTLTAPSAGTYTVNAGFKNPSRLWGTTSVTFVSAPPAPTGLNTNPVSNTQINLTWTDNSSTEDGFKIERKLGPSGTWSQIAQVGSNVVSYNNTGLTASTQYCYRVRSYNTAGNSAYTNEDCSTTYPNIPNAPGSLTALINSNPLSVELAWIDNSSDESGFYIEREDPVSDVYNIIDSVSANVTTYQDLTVALLTYNYRVSAYNISGVSSYSNIAVAIVPVELTSFTASYSNNTVTLDWTTATETNNIGFEIERSQDIPAEQTSWVKIGFVEGNGTTTEQQKYSFTDKNISTGKYIYRLKQIDYDGSFSYSNTVTAEINSVPEQYSLFQNYPNPFNPSTSIKFAIPEKGLVTIKVYNVLGNEIAILMNEEKESGTYEIKFDAAGLPSGIYFYTVTSNNFSDTKKMILLK